MDEVQSGSPAVDQDDSRNDEQPGSGDKYTDSGSDKTEDAAPDTASGSSSISNAVNNISNGRLEIAKLYLDNLNMTGHRGMMIEGSGISHSHNAYLQAAYDFGIPTGIIFTLWVMLSAVISLYRYLKHKDNGDLLSFGISLSFLLVAFTEWNFHYCNPTTIISLLCIMPLLYLQETETTEDK